MKMTSRFLLGTVLAGTIAATAPAVWASSHREAPAIAGMPRVDSTDFYMFRSYEPGRAGFVTLIANYIPLQAPYGGPNYFTLDNDAIYELHIDNTGDAVEDITFQFNFNTQLANSGAGLTIASGFTAAGAAGPQVAIPLRQIGPLNGTGGRLGNLNETETYTLTMITGDRRSGTRTALRPVQAPITGQPTIFVKPVDNIGGKTIPDYNAYANSFIENVSFGTCGTGKVFVGQRAENFAVNLGEIFDLVNLVPIQGGTVNPDFPQYAAGPAFAAAAGINQNRANDDVVGEANVTSIAVEVPIACVTGTTAGRNGVIGGWTSASLPQARTLDPTPTYNGTASNGGAFVQVSRLSNPLVNEVVIGLRDKDRFNSSEPKDDAQFAQYVTNPTLPALINALFLGPVNSLTGANFTNLAPTNPGRVDLQRAFLTGFSGVNQVGSSPTRAVAEMIRLNTGIPVTPLATQSVFGVAGGDNGGFPNGRRPTDDTVDIALRVVMGALCHIGAGTNPATPTALGGCSPSQAPIGFVPLTDGAPLDPSDLSAVFPYLNPPIPGSPN
jgi:hypothetical protein